MTSAGAKRLLIGNPTRTAGEFYDAFHRNRASYRRIHIGYRDAPAFTGEQVPQHVADALLSRGWVEDKIRKWGEDSPLFHVRVLGDFPAQSEDTVIDLGAVEDAQARELVGQSRAATQIVDRLRRRALRLRRDGHRRQGRRSRADPRGLRRQADHRDGRPGRSDRQGVPAEARPDRRRRRRRRRRRHRHPARAGLRGHRLQRRRHARSSRTTTPTAAPSLVRRSPSGCPSSTSTRTTSSRPTSPLRVRLRLPWPPRRRAQGRDEEAPRPVARTAATWRSSRSSARPRLAEEQRDVRVDAQRRAARGAVSRRDAADPRLPLVPRAQRRPARGAAADLDGLQPPDRRRRRDQPRPRRAPVPLRRPPRGRAPRDRLRPLPLRAGLRRPPGRAHHGERRLGRASTQARSAAAAHPQRDPSRPRWRPGVRQGPGAQPEPHGRDRVHPRRRAARRRRAPAAAAASVDDVKLPDRPLAASPTPRRPPPASTSPRSSRRTSTRSTSSRRPRTLRADQIAGPRRAGQGGRRRPRALAQISTDPVGAEQIAASMRAIARSGALDALSEARHQGVTVDEIDLAALEDEIVARRGSGRADARRDVSNTAARAAVRLSWRDRPGGRPRRQREHVPRRAEVAAGDRRRARRAAGRAERGPVRQFDAVEQAAEDGDDLLPLGAAGHEHVRAVRRRRTATSTSTCRTSRRASPGSAATRCARARSAAGARRSPWYGEAAPTLQ
jgi:hypothetical protein